MKKWGFYFIIIMTLGILVYQNIGEYSNNNQALRKSTGSIIIRKNMIYQGNLLLVNKNYPVHNESVKSDIVFLSHHPELVTGYGFLDSGIKLSIDVAQKFSEMMKAANMDGVHHFMINSAYRNIEEQNKLYKQMGSSYALPPGNSEHNLGLSLDVGSTEMKMDRAPEGKWLQENAWKFGFILRYPKDKTRITGIQFEPWHIRYVGLPHSVIMHENNLALEEYLSFLKEKKNLTINYEGITYNILYYPVSLRKTVKLPKKHSYEVSGNNIDGIIITVSSPE